MQGQGGDVAATSGSGGASVAPTACIHFLSGRCRFGDRCRAGVHDPSAVRPQCAYFARGFCSRGDACMYSHGRGDDAAARLAAAAPPPPAFRATLHARAPRAGRAQRPPQQQQEERTNQHPSAAQPAGARQLCVFRDPTQEELQVGAELAGEGLLVCRSCWHQPARQHPPLPLVAPAALEGHLWCVHPQPVGRAAPLLCVQEEWRREDQLYASSSGNSYGSRSGSGGGNGSESSFEEAGALEEGAPLVGGGAAGAAASAAGGEAAQQRQRRREERGVRRAAERQQRQQNRKAAEQVPPLPEVLVTDEFKELCW